MDFRKVVNIPSEYAECTNDIIHMYIHNNEIVVPIFAFFPLRKLNTPSKAISINVMVGKKRNNPLSRKTVGANVKYMINSGIIILLYFAAVFIIFKYYLKIDLQ